MTADRMLTLCFVLSIGLPAAASAEDNPAQAAIVIGSVTESILDRQRQGNEAGVQLPVSGEVATRTYKRYLDSYNNPMPLFNQTVGSSLKSDSGGD